MSTVIWRAEKTLAAIHAAMTADGGNKFRELQGKAMPLMTDAYRADDGVRSHLGASKIGSACERYLWYSFRWFYKSLPGGFKYEKPEEAYSRMLRLWNRGHLEEGRFLALLWLIGIVVYQQDGEGKQFKIAEFGGHFGGSGDGIGIGVPDLPYGVPCLHEFKTHGSKSFAKLVEDGVLKSKPEHYCQMQTYMFKFGLQYALYLAVNKDTDELYAEIIQLDVDSAQRQIDKAERVIFAIKPPARIRNASPGYSTCRFCDAKDVCFGTVKPKINCRTCRHVVFNRDGKVYCESPAMRVEADQSGWEDPIELSKESQIRGCNHFELLEPHR